MNNRLLSKLAILVAAFVVNGFEFAGVDYLFSGEMHQRSDWVSLGQADGASSTVGHAGRLIATL